MSKTLHFSLSLAPKLKPTLIERRGDISKMKVGNATNLLSPAVGAALEFTGKATEIYEFVTIAWFVSNIVQAPPREISKDYRNKVKYLEETINLIQNIRVGENGQ